MIEVWLRLESLVNSMQFILDQKLNKYEEESLKKYHRPEGGWINKTWNNYCIYRAHLDVVDARDSKGLWMAHLCIFPSIEYNLPIFGFDVIAGKTKVTGAFLDLSYPNHFYDYNKIGKPKFLQDFFKYSQKLQWNKERKLPEWAEEIFSPSMIAASNITTQEELDRFCNVALFFLHEYLLDNSEKLPSNSTIRLECEMQKFHQKYSENQRKNPHTPRVMRSLGLDDEEVEDFIQNCLFPQS